jgi:hypothetical protein
MRQRRRSIWPLVARSLGVLIALLVVAASAGRPSKDASTQGDGVIAAKAPQRTVVPLVKRLPDLVTDRLPGIDLPVPRAWVATSPGATSDLTRPLYLQVFLAGHPQQRRAPPV